MYILKPKNEIRQHHTLIAYITDFHVVFAFYQSSL